MHFVDKCKYVVVVIFGFVSAMSFLFSRAPEARTMAMTMACTVVILAFLPNRGESGRRLPSRGPEE